MNKQETVQLLLYIKAAFPNWGKNLSDEEANAMVLVWHDMLGEYDVSLIKMALKGAVATSEFPPSIAEVIESINNITKAERTMTDVEAWGLVKKAIRNSTYNSKSEFEKLPEVIQRTIGNHEILRSWALEENDNTDKVIGSQFMRSYRSKLSEVKNYEALPSDVKQLIDMTTKKMLE